MNIDFYLVIPARNVETTLERAIITAHNQLKKDYQLLVVENGSNDGTYNLAKFLERTYDRIPLRVLTSSPGKIRALVTALDEMKTGKPVLFMDGDVEATNSSFKPLLHQMTTNQELIIVSGHPVTPENYSLKENTSYLNLSSFFPLSKKVEDNKYGFKKANLDPQPNIDPKIEGDLKPFFHGRIYCVRDKKFIPDIIPRGNIADDIFWSRYILSNFGPGSIRTRYDARVFHFPRTTEEEFLKYRLRIQQQVNDLTSEFPEFNSLSNALNTKRDWSYITSLPEEIIQLFKKEREIYSKNLLFKQKIPWHGDL